MVPVEAFDNVARKTVVPRVEDRPKAEPSSSGRISPASTKVWCLQTSASTEAAHVFVCWQKEETPVVPEPASTPDDATATRAVDLAYRTQQEDVIRLLKLGKVTQVFLGDGLRALISGPGSC
jgi:hypothetical protein